MNRDELIQEIERNKLIANELEGRLLARNLFTFNKKVLHVEEGSGVVHLAPFHKEMCDFAQSPAQKKLMLLPRGHLKSTLVTIGYSLMRIAEDPSIRILIANATYDMAVSFLTQIKKHIQYNETFKQYYGDLSSNAQKWSENMITVPKFTPFAKKEATVTAYGMGGNLVSQHYDLIIGDDLVNRDYIGSYEQIEKTILFYKDALDLLEPTGQIVLLGTRWADADLYGWVMDKSTPEQVYKDFSIMVKRAYEGDLNSGAGFKALFPEKFTPEYIKILKTNKGPIEFSCTPAETPIVMSDWTEKRIEDVQEGDEVIGWNKGQGRTNGRIIKSKVLRTMKKRGDIYKLTMESGRNVFSTLDHRWYTGRLDKTHKEYAVPKLKRKLQYMYSDLPLLTTQEQRAWDYLAGIFDGEGSATSGGCLEITQGMGRNMPVTQKIKDTLSFLGLSYNEYIKVSKDQNVSQMWIKDNFNTHIKFLNYTNLAKKQQLIDNLYKRSSKFVKAEDRITNIEYVREDDIYALQTETGNYIAWGYGSSNSQYMNEPLPQESAKFKMDWMKTISDDELKHRDLNVFTMVDPAIGQKKTSDKTAIVTIAVDQFNNWHVINIIWDHFLPNQIIDAIFKNWEIHQPNKIGIELTAYQKSLQYALVDEMRRRNIFLPIVELKAEKSKEERIMGLVPRYANGTIYHLDQCPFKEDMEDQLMRFPVGKHDDIIDALAYGMQIAFPTRNKSTKPRRRTNSQDDWDESPKKKKYLY